MPSAELKELLEKFLDETISPGELATLQQFAKDPAHAAFMQHWMEQVLAEDRYGAYSDFDTDEMFREVMHKAAPAKVRPMRRWGWAAAVLLLLAAGAYWLTTDKKETPQTTHTADIQPGRTGAVLTLGDGSQVSLDTIQQGIVAAQGGSTAKVVDGALMYEGNGNEVVYNIMSTPRGRQFHLVLPDGTGVWLNAATSIRYPTRFTGKERRVEVSGEAYFEVAKNEKMPFVLDINKKAAINVLGTKFNVNAYDNEQLIHATLLEGKIRVAAGGEHSSVVLAPGEQARIAGEADIKVVPGTDVAKVMAWKNGLFNFEGAKLEDVMRQLERWYDIDVIYEKGIPDITFGGEISRGVSLQGVLSGLEGSEVHFRIDGRKLIVLP